MRGREREEERGRRGSGRRGDGAWGGGGEREIDPTREVREEREGGGR